MHAKNCFWVVLLHLVAFFSIQHAHAQSRIDTLQNVNITTSNGQTLSIRSWLPGQKIIEVDSAVLSRYQLQSVATLINQQLPVYVRAYSMNGLSSFSFRGASAAQSQVLWNGIPVQNPATGIADLSQLPVAFATKVSIVYGGAAALTGSGNVGGALMINSEQPIFDSALHSGKVVIGVGSFGQNLIAGEGIAATRKWHMSVRVSAQEAKNNFRYTDDNGGENQLTNSSTSGFGALLHYSRKTGLRSTVQIFLWGQQYNRSIPPALFEPISVKQQNDASYRSLIHWAKKLSGGQVYFKTAVTSESTRYSDYLVMLRSSYLSSQYYQEIGWENQITRRSHLLFFSPVQLSWLTNPISHVTHNQGRVALVAAYRIISIDGRMVASANARAEKVDGNAIFLPGVNGSYKIAHFLTVQANFQETYRVPTLNEQFFFPGGNTELKPEKGWCLDGGYTVHLQKQRVVIKHTGSIFGRDVRDWIIWLGGAIWTPHNVARVYSRGVETDNEINGKIKNILVHGDVHTAYVLSTTEESYQPGDGSLHQQLPYSPRYNIRANLSMTFKKVTFNYNYGYTGYRNTNADGSATLAPFQLSNLALSYEWPVSRYTFQVSGQINNLWSERYFLVASRPLPGRNFLICLSTQLH